MVREKKQLIKLIIVFNDYANDNNSNYDNDNNDNDVRDTISGFLLT